MADDPREEATASKKGEEAAALDKVTDQVRSGGDPPDFFLSQY